MIQKALQKNDITIASIRVRKAEALDNVRMTVQYPETFSKEKLTEILEAIPEIVAMEIY
ncbi:hypothetical protein PDA01_17450 [Pediococcus damnosus]|uniref:hypothetical protein n=1 Tax=Pediococcus damnosus TaxID=51663 RepID=UPI00116EAC2A|nr:hypothetical protein [Pediococcus damnosus]GEA93852.1 hypothetical protein PDA01_17450 [Pediococcus damnosus]